MDTLNFYESADRIIQVVGGKQFTTGTVQDLAQVIESDPETAATAAFALRDDYRLLTFQTDMGHVLMAGTKLVGHGSHLYHSGIGLKEHLNPPSVAPTTVTNNVSGGTVNQQIGNGNSQTVTITVSESQIRDLISSLRAADLGEAADIIDEETHSGANPGRIVAALDQAKSVLTAAGGVGGALTSVLALFG